MLIITLIQLIAIKYDFIRHLPDSILNQILNQKFDIMYIIYIYDKKDF